MKVENDELIFSTGKRAYANNGIIGLSPTGEVSEGYDGSFPSLTNEEKLELANYMLARWEEFKLSIPRRVRGD